jgi:membrane protein YdbS with pleckstrin-like domain
MPVTRRPATGLPDDARPVRPPAVAASAQDEPAAAAPPDAAPAPADSPGPGSLPLIGDAAAERHRLSPRVMAYWRWRWLLSLLPMLELLAGLVIFVPWPDGWIRWSVFTIVAVAGFLGLIVLPPIRYRVFWYAISPTEIDIQHGIVFIKRSVIPMHRVQSLRVERGPIANHYRMANLRITTAAGSMSCSGLGRREADDVCSRISELSDVADDV